MQERQTMFDQLGRIKECYLINACMYLKEGGRQMDEERCIVTGLRIVA